MVPTWCPVTPDWVGRGQGRSAHPFRQASPPSRPSTPAAHAANPSSAGRPWRDGVTRATIHRLCSTSTSVGAWRSLVARIVRDDEVGGSNPLAPTIPVASWSSARTRAPPWCPQRTAVPPGGPDPTCRADRPPRRLPATYRRDRGGRSRASVPARLDGFAQAVQAIAEYVNAGNVGQPPDPGARPPAHRRLGPTRTAGVLLAVRQPGFGHAVRQGAGHHRDCPFGIDLGRVGNEETDGPERPSTTVKGEGLMRRARALRCVVGMCCPG